MINKQCRNIIGILLIILVFPGCDSIPKEVIESYYSGINPKLNLPSREKIEYFFHYRKYVNGEKTCKMTVSAVGRIPDEHIVILNLTDLFDDSYERPYFLNNKYILFRDSSLTMLWGKGYTEVLADFKAEIGDTLKSKVSSGWIFNKRDLYFGLPLYEMGNVLPGTRIPQRIQYVHNLGFILHEVSYADSTIAWKLETINGVPFDTIAINFPEVYEYF